MNYLQRRLAVLEWCDKCWYSQPAIKNRYFVCFHGNVLETHVINAISKCEGKYFEKKEK